MGWLKKAVSLWKGSTQKAATTEEVPLSQIQEWIQQRSQEAIEQHRLVPTVREHAKILEEKRWLLEVKLDAWQKKVRLHPSAHEIIPLFRETRRILELLHFSHQPSVGEVVAINQELEEKLKHLLEKLEGSDFAHNFEFIVDEEDQAAQETNPLLAVLLDLDALRKKLEQKIGQSQYNILHLIGAKAETLHKVVRYGQQLEKELKIKNSRIYAAGHKRMEKEKSLQELHRDEMSLDIEELKKRKVQAQQRFEEREMEIIAFFSKIKPLLQQYKGFEPSNGLIYGYLSDPFASFLEDEGLFIVEILQKMMAMLQEGKLQLNQEDLLSSLSAMEGAYSQRLRLLKDDYVQLQQELRKLSDQVQHHYFVVKLDDAAYRAEHYNKQVAKLTQEISGLKEKQIKVQQVLLREQEELRNLINSSLGREVTIIISSVTVLQGETG